MEVVVEVEMAGAMCGRDEVEAMWGRVVDGAGAMWGRDVAGDMGREVLMGMDATVKELTGNKVVGSVVMTW